PRQGNRASEQWELRQRKGKACHSFKRRASLARQNLVACTNVRNACFLCFLQPAILLPSSPGDTTMARTRKNDKAEDGIKVICRNKRAFHEYIIQDRLECGLVLTGTEVKSLREGSSSLEDAYAKVDNGEVWLLGSDIPEYSMARRWNHKPKRPRK